MFGFRRNQQPSLPGNTWRVRSDGKTAFPELQYAREAVLEACRRAGGLFAHWRRFTPEFNIGRCPNCYNPITDTPSDANCPVCFGTGFEGGYSAPTVQHMIIQHVNRRVEATDSGFLRINELQSQAPYLPNIASLDILGEIKNIEGDIIIDDRYLIEDNVDKERFRLHDILRNPDTYDHLDPESDVIAYNFRASRIYKHTDPERRDIRYSIPFENPVWLADKGRMG